MSKIVAPNVQFRWGYSDGMDHAKTGKTIVIYDHPDHDDHWKAGYNAGYAGATDGKAYPTPEGIVLKENLHEYSPGLFQKIQD